MNCEGGSGGQTEASPLNRIRPAVYGTNGASMRRKAGRRNGERGCASMAKVHSLVRPLRIEIALFTVLSTYWRWRFSVPLWERSRPDRFRLASSTLTP